MASKSLMTFKRLAGMSRRYTGWYLLVGLLCLATSLGDIANTESLRRLVDAAARKSFHQMYIALYYGVGGFTVSAICRLVTDYMTAWLDQISVMKLQDSLVERAHNISQEFIDKNHSGDVITRILDNASAAQGGLNGNAISLVQNIISVAVFIVYLAKLSVPLTVGTVAAACAIPAALIPLSSYLQCLWKDRQKIEGKLSAFIQDAVQGGEVARSFGLLSVFLRRFDEQYQSLLNKIMKTEVWGQSTNLAMWTIVVSGLFFVLGYGGNMVATGVMTVGTVTVFVISFERLGFPISTIIQVWPNLQRSLSAADRVYELLDAPLESEGWGQNSAMGAEAFTKSGSICFRNVGFGYGDGPDVVKELCFEAEAGKLTAIVGESGSGKSTLIKLLMGTYRPRSGSITYGELPITDFRLDRWRSILGYVSQDVYLFTGTIRENIAMGRQDAPESEVLAAASAANCDEFIFGLPELYDAPIGESGVKFSGGQRQRIAIARAILKHPEILLLDEATSSLDNESERLVQDALDRFCQGRTTIVIAHRLSTIMGADKIIFLENGQVLEQGSHHKLMEDKGRYYDMFTAAYGSGEAEEVAV